MVNAPGTSTCTVILTAAASNAAGGVDSEKSSLSMTNTNVSVSSGEPAAALNTEQDSSVTIASSSLRQNGSELGAKIEGSPATVNGLRVEMVNNSSTSPALLIGNESSALSLAHLEIGGTWTGMGVNALGGDLTLADSRVTESPLSSSAALRYDGTAGGRGLFVQRSVLKAGANAKPGAVVVERGNATFDSSEILGGRNGVYFDSPEAKSIALTISASTVDAGEPGIEHDLAGTTGIEAIAKAASGGVAATIQGSIVLEKQIASSSPGDTASISCSYSAVPSQSQAAGGGSGSISCLNGATGNTDVSPISTLFSEPLAAYQLSPASSAVDSIPAGAIALPFGLTPSSTDLGGSPRVVDGNGDCKALQDKGALELQGHAAVCPVPIIAKAPLPSISALTIGPGAFFAAPSGPTASAAKKRYGATVSYRDSLAATATFTVLVPTAGRRQGAGCVKPSHKNRRGKRCKYLRALGSFTHADRAGANRLHFSGRIKGRRLPAGSYELKVVPRDAAGSGPAVEKAFKIR